MHNDQGFAACDKSSNVPRSLTGASSIAAADRRCDLCSIEAALRHYVRPSFCWRSVPMERGAQRPPTLVVAAKPGEWRTNPPAPAQGRPLARCGATSREGGSPIHFSAGRMFWFPRKKLVGSYSCLSAASRW